MGSGTGLGGCHACIKYLMFAFNFVFWLIGCGLVGVGIWVLVDDSFKELVADSTTFDFLQHGGIILVAAGAVIMVVGFFGCCGAIRESECCLVLFFICMLILFLGLVAGGVACIMFKDQVSDIALDAFDEKFATYTKDDPKDFVDLVQKVFSCCGANSVADYIGKGGVPDSCDPKKLEDLKGCKLVVPEKLGETVVIAAGVALGAGATMLIGMIFSMMLCCAIRDQN